MALNDTAGNKPAAGSVTYSPTFLVDFNLLA